MKNIINNKWTALTLSALCLVLATLIMGRTLSSQVAQAASTEPEVIIKYVEVISDDVFDTSVIEAQWCGGFSDGVVRMVGAWWYADGVVEDELGQLWAVEQSFEQTDFLLLWIANNNTPNNTTDDVVIKVWREAY